MVIRYPFHPRFGERITVIGMNNYRGESYLTIRQSDGTLALLPPWMADEDAARMRVVLKPALPHPVLVELLRLVDAALSSLTLSTREGGSYAHTGNEAEGPVRGVGAGDVGSRGPDGQFKLLHLWAAKFPQAGRADYASDSSVTASLVAASRRR